VANMSNTLKEVSGRTKVLITGGAGFIGSNTADLLIENGHDVVIVDDLSTGSKHNINPKAAFYKCDITSLLLIDVFRKEKPSIVLHTAAQVRVRASAEDPLSDAKTNVLGTLNVLECCRDSGVKKIIYSSSGGAGYGEPQSIPCKEDHPIRPISHYGASKLSAELFFPVYKSTYGLDFTILRYANVYGSRQDAKGEAGVVAIFLDKITQDSRPSIFGDGEQSRDFVFVADVARANLLAVQRPALNAAVNIGTGKETTVNQIFSFIKKATGTKLAPTHAVKVAGEVFRITLDPSMAKRLLGWSPRVSIEEGIGLTAEWFRKKE